MGGFDADGSKISSVERYLLGDESQGWEAVAPMLEVKGSTWAVILRGELHAFSKTEVEKYDPLLTETDGQWKRVHMAMPKNNEGRVCLDDLVVLDGELYALVQYKVKRYNRELDRWDALEGEPDANSIAVLDCELYVTGGYEHITGRTQKYVAGEDRWQDIAPTNESRSCPTMTALRGELYALGGFSSTDGKLGPCKIVEKYDRFLDRWETVASMDEARCGHGAVSVFGYAVGLIK
jgi:hypothetical protein